MGAVNYIPYFLFQILDKLSPGIINGEGLQEEVHVCVCVPLHALVYICCIYGMIGREDS